MVQILLRHPVFCDC